MAQPNLELARELGPFIREHAPEGERIRRLPEPVVERFRDAGFFRMCVPRVYGGPEVPALDMIAILDEIAYHDGAAGWCANISSTTSTLSGFLQPEWAREVFSGERDAYGGTFIPNGRAASVEGGWTVDGRWPWGSGTHHCAWVNGGAITDTGEMRLMFYRRDDVEWFDTWHSVGLRGTGSGDFGVKGAFVPRGREIFVGKVWAQVDSPVSRFPNFNLLAAGVASVTLGIARRAIDEAFALGEKRPAMQRSTLAEHVPAQEQLAEAEARLSGGRAFLREEVARTWDLVVRGERPDGTSKARLRLAASHAAREAVRATDLAFTVGGGSAVFESSPLQKCHRDIHTAYAHQMIGERHPITYAKLRLGLEVDTGLL